MASQTNGNRPRTSLPFQNKALPIDMISRALCMVEILLCHLFVGNVLQNIGGLTLEGLAKCI